jgi:hypothetical protein
MTAANRVLKRVWGIITIGRGVVLKERQVEITWGATELVFAGRAPQYVKYARGIFTGPRE